MVDYSYSYGVISFIDGNDRKSIQGEGRGRKEERGQ